MAKTIEAVKDVVKEVKDGVKDAFKGVEADAVVSSLQTLLDSKRHSAPPTDYLFFGPADALLARMQAASGSKKGLPETAELLVKWFERPLHKKVVREAHITIELSPSWAGRQCTLIRLERAPRLPKEYPIVPF